MPAPVASDELPSLLAVFADRRHIVLGVSGGSDSTALMLLAVRWREGGGRTPMTVVTVDHGLRAESDAECLAVAARAAAMGLPCLIRRWEEPKPATRLQESARNARYALLEEAAAQVGADAIATAHTLDDQAETVLMRFIHGSAVDGLAAMRPVSRRGALVHLRPLLDTPKARLVATLEAAGLDWSEDPSNRSERFERVRMRALLDVLGPFGVEPERLALLARRAARSADALEAIARELYAAALGDGPGVSLDARSYAAAPAEIRLRILGRAIAAVQGDDAPTYGLRLERLETLAASLDEVLRSGRKGWRRNIGGALVSLDGSLRLVFRPEPERRRGRLGSRPSM